MTATNHIRVCQTDLLPERMGESARAREDWAPGVPLLMTVSEIAGVLRLSRKGVYELLRSGGLGYIKVGRRVRVRREQLFEFIAERTVPVPGIEHSRAARARVADRSG